LLGDHFDGLMPFDILVANGEFHGAPSYGWMDRDSDSRMEPETHR
jgi:hypothetical protein